MFKYRLISFPLLLGLVAVIFFWQPCGELIFEVLAPVVGAMIAYELSALLKKLDFPASPLFAAAVTIVVWSFFSSCIPWKIHLHITWVIGLLALIPVAWASLLSRKTAFFRHLLGSFAVAGIVTVTFCWLMLLYRVEGEEVLLYTILTSKAMDTGGYIFGMLSARLMPNGNHKIAPSLSPKKSWEGFFGGLLFSLGVSMIFYRVYPGMSLSFMLAAGAVLGIGSFFGDLTESALKRAADVKDSGHWIPGMGGALDVADSLIYNGLIMWLLCNMPDFF